MDGHIDLKKRLELLEIDDDTRRYMASFKPTLLKALDGLIDNLYVRILRSKQAQRMLATTDMQALHIRQRIHWLSLFSCDFDQNYVQGALHVGDVHYEYGIAPYLYISGYSFMKSELIRLACLHHREDEDLAEILVAIIKLSSLDMDLALSAYTRDALSHQAIKAPGARNLPKTVYKV